MLLRLESNSMFLRPIIFLAAIFLSNLIFAQKEDSLLYLKGEKIKTVEQWEKKRPIIKSTFLSEVYGQMPPRPNQKFTVSKILFIH